MPDLQRDAHRQTTLKPTMADNHVTLENIVANRDTLLAELDRGQGLLRDYVRSVARHYSTGAFVYGPPGTGKTHIVTSVLENEIQEIFTYQRGHLTPLGLFELIAQYASDVLVLDDLGAVLRSDVALQILMAALEHPVAHKGGRKAAQV